VKAWEARYNHAALAATALSGVVYGVLKYFVPARDPDSTMAVPWQPAVLKAHVLAAPFLVFGLGLIFARHALGRLKAGERQGRRSGLLLLALGAPAVLSGYLIPALTGAAAARWTGWIHTALGVLLAAFWLSHRISRPVSREDEPPGA
jgi:hypothetical protein